MLTRPKCGVFLIVIVITALRGQGCHGALPQCLESASALDWVLESLNQRVRCSWTEP
jgi:hypothetical protein